MPVAGGTDLRPNLKHRLFTPADVGSLNGLGAMRGIKTVEGPGAGTGIASAPNSASRATASGTVRGRW